MDPDQTFGMKLTKPYKELLGKPVHVQVGEQRHYGILSSANGHIVLRPHVTYITASGNPEEKDTMVVLPLGATPEELTREQYDMVLQPAPITEYVGQRVRIDGPKRADIGTLESITHSYFRLRPHISHDGTKAFELDRPRYIPRGKEVDIMPITEEAYQSNLRPPQQPRDEPKE